MVVATMLDSVKIKHFHHGRKFCQCWEQTRRQVIIINTREELYDGGTGAALHWEGEQEGSQF